MGKHILMERLLVSYFLFLIKQETFQAKVQAQVISEKSQGLR